MALLLCENCRKNFFTYRLKRKFCSKECFLKSPINTSLKRGDANVSKRDSVKEKMSKAKIGFTPWNKGRFGYTTKMKGRKMPQWSGKNHPNFKGKIIDSSGYVLIFSPNHPHKNSQNYIFEHRLIMEQEIGRFLDPKEVVHHIDRDKSNNHPKNLMLFSSHAEHMREHKCNL